MLKLGGTRSTSQDARTSPVRGRRQRQQSHVRVVIPSATARSGDRGGHTGLEPVAVRGSGAVRCYFEGPACGGRGGESAGQLDCWTVGQLGSWTVGQLDRARVTCTRRSRRKDGRAMSTNRWVGG
eukprot:1185781-Prorocentrum_minimum.AAC.11